jgi:hypothetical protein
MVSRILGHASITTTANVYGHVTDAMLDKASNGPTQSSAGGAPEPARSYAGWYKPNERPSGMTDD